MGNWIGRIRAKLPKSVLFYALGLYVLLQFGWWAYMLVNLNAEIYDLKLQLLRISELGLAEQQVLKAELDQKLSLRIWMVLGEGAVFVLILLLGFWAVQRSIVNELRVAEQQKNFLLSITHELKSPLAAIKLHLQTLRSRQLPNAQKAQLYDRALMDADRLQKLVENLLLVNKVESGNLPLAKQRMMLTDKIHEWIHNTYSAEITEERVSLELEPGIETNADELAIQSIVLNLVDNALKYGAGSMIRISLKQMPDDQLQIGVSDLGSGISDDEKERVFERFYRQGNEEVRQTKGTGIGLYLTRLLVETHGGHISVQDNKPSGARFIVTLPMGKT